MSSPSIPQNHPSFQMFTNAHQFSMSGVTIWAVNGNYNHNQGDHAEVRRESSDFIGEAHL
ncbi:hypothetical protein D9758_016742 [Tetrapyrgos nigripes]|nr:hypothetical protein D9758_016742 [Tetrapyrgos nigripes]